MKFFLLLITIAAVTFCGCSTTRTLNAGGAYNGDVKHYNNDNVIDNTQQALDVFLKLALANQDKTPASFKAVVHSLAQRAPIVIQTAAKASAAYSASPTADNLHALSAEISVLNDLLKEIASDQAQLPTT